MLAQVSSHSVLIPVFVMTLIAAGCGGGGGSGGNGNNNGGGADPDPDDPIENQAPELQVTDQTTSAAIYDLVVSLSDDGDSDPTLTMTQTDGPATALISGLAELAPQLRFPLVGAYTFDVFASDGDLVAEASVTVTVTSEAPLGFDIEAQKAGLSSPGEPVSIIWHPTGETVLTAESDAAGMVSLTGLLGAPNDFQILAGSD